MESKSKIYVLLAVIFIIVGIATYYTFFKIEKGNSIIEDVCIPNISFLKEADNILVYGIVDSCNLSDDEFTWDNISLEGTGIKPSGIIKEGDIISDCQGYVKIIWIPENKVIFDEYF